MAEPLSREEREDAARRIIHFLGGRKGFDWWWGDVDEESREEIVQGIANCIRRYREEAGDG